MGRVPSRRYTLPWDDYLVASGIWGYGEGRINPDWLVMHTPGEEVAFFSIQTIIVAAIWYLRFGCGATDPVKLLATPRLLPKADQEWLLAVRRVGYGVITALFFAGVTMLSGTFGEAGTYGGLILTWVSPVLMVQVSRRRVTANLPGNDSGSARRAPRGL